MYHIVPPDPVALAARTRSLIDAGRVVAARPLLAALGRLAPDPARLAELTARLMLREGRQGEASQVLDDAVGLASCDAKLRSLRAGVRAQAGDLPGAAADAAEAVVLDRADPDAKAVLGMVLIELGQFDDALPCLREAVAAHPADASCWLALAEACGRGQGAAAQTACLADAVAHNPVHGGLRNAAAAHRLAQHDFEGALAMADAARRIGVADAATFGLMGRALSHLGRAHEALACHAEALKLAPEDAARHFVAGALQPAERADPAMIRAVFDRHAGDFNTNQIALGNRVPGLVRAALEAHGPGGPVLDLGCGTGLLAVACSDCDIGPWTGVDLSPAMLGEARSFGLYAELIEADLMDAMAGPGPAFPLILAGDVACYFGPLAPVLAAIRPRLAPGGSFVLNTEELASEPAGGIGSYAPIPSGGYAHTAGHVAAAAVAAGFDIVHSRPETLRWERGVPVAGRLTVLSPQP